MQSVTPTTPPDAPSLTNPTGEGNETLDEEREIGTIDGQQSPEFSTELLVLDSLFPMVKLFPGLTKEKSSSYYYVQGQIEASDQESLSNYAKRIGELTLGPEPDSESHLAPHVLTRIARLQDPNKPLFPLLHRLRIVNTSSALNFLDLLLSSALKTLELTEIPADDRYSSVLSFFECAIHQAPNLSTLILGPGRIQDQILDISLRYNNLRCLKLLDVGISITNQFLQDVGSLRHLETFALRDNGTSTYKLSPAIPGFSEIVGSALFSALRTFEVDGTFDLIQDLVAKITSSDLRALSIDITKPLKEVPIEIMEEKIKLTVGKKKKKTSSLNSTPTPPPPPPPPAPPQLSTTDIMTLLRHTIQKWPNTLVSVSFRNGSTQFFSLASDVFEDLLLRPDMKHLEITGMGIDSMDSALLRFVGVVDSKLEELHLPIHSISLARLRDIAEACPHLKSLRCRLRTWDLNLSEITVSSPLSHQLGVLSVFNEQAKLDQHLSLWTARYLDSIFPSLKSLKTHDGNGNNTEQWGFIFDMMKSYRAVRMDEHQRLGF